METLDWPSTKLNWEPIGKYGMCVAVWQDYIWVTGKSGQVHCMTFDTASEFVEWLNDELRKHNAKQESSPTKVDARSSGWSQAKEGWPHQTGRPRVRSG